MSETVKMRGKTAFFASKEICRRGFEIASYNELKYSYMGPVVFYGKSTVTLA